MFLDAETFAAGAGGGGVGVGDDEAGVLEVVGVVEGGSGDVEGAFGVDEEVDALGGDEVVFWGGGVDDVHLVLEAGAAATDDGDAECGGVLFGGEELEESGGGFGGDGAEFFCGGFGLGEGGVAHGDYFRGKVERLQGGGWFAVGCGWGWRVEFRGGRR